MQNVQICKDNTNADRFQTPFATLVGIVKFQIKAKRKYMTAGA